MPTFVLDLEKQEILKLKYRGIKIIKPEVLNDISFDTSHNQNINIERIFYYDYVWKIKTFETENHLTQKELGIALGFPEDSADVRIAQYEADARKPRDEILTKMAKILYVLIDVPPTVPVLSEPREYDAASF